MPGAALREAGVTPAVQSFPLDRLSRSQPHPRIYTIDVRRALNVCVIFKVRASQACSALEL